MTGLPGFLPRQYRSIILGIPLAWTLLAAGCAVTSEPLHPSEIAERVRGDRERMYVDQEPVRAPLTLEEAAARAIKYNLDYRLQLMESALQQGVLDVSQFDMLPRLTASAGYVARDNELYSQYQTLGEPYDPNLPYSRSTESARRLAGAELSWNLLDFGVSYYRARAQADQVLIAQEAIQHAPENFDVTADIVAAVDQRLPTVGTTPPAGWQPRRETVQIHQGVQQILLAAAQQQALRQQQQQQPAQTPQGR